MGKGKIGGLVGYSSGGSISLSQSSGSVAVSVANGCVYSGGLVGYAQGTAIQKSKSSSSLTVLDSGGGLVGYLNTGGSVVDSYATGNISGSQLGNCWFGATSTFLGVLVGAMTSVASNIQNSYATGSVTSDGTELGALLGLGFNNSTLTNTFSTGLVTGSSVVGGVIGGNNTAVATNAYWDTFGTGLANGSGIGYGSDAGQTGIDTSAPGNSHYFHNSSNAPLSSWDFTTIWYTDSTSYPVLRWELD